MSQSQQASHLSPASTAWPLPQPDFDLTLWRSYKPYMPTLNCDEFPEDFVFGTASSAYQFEGAWNEDGKGPSIWDTFTQRPADGHILDYSDGKVAVDFYHRYLDDIDLMKEVGLKAFRFSISWSRVLPSGNAERGVNEKGIEFYNKVIDKLLANGIEPFVTLFHFDTPEALESMYKGFLCPEIVVDFCTFADLCFERFGDRVKHWITANEPWSFCFAGYGTGALAPGRRSRDLSFARDFIEPIRFFPWNLSVNDADGDSATEPYKVAHNLLLAHAHAVKLYRQKYQKRQGGKIGITNVSIWAMPFSNIWTGDLMRDDRRAASRYMDFMLGWFMEPLTKGDYPHTMKLYVKDRLPKFTPYESNLVKGSFDFLGLNYYTSYYTIDASTDQRAEKPSVVTDPHVILKIERNGMPIGVGCGASWLYDCPEGIKELLLYIKNKYDNPVIYITENGVAGENKFEYPPKNVHLDVQRINYHYGHLKVIKDTIRKRGVNVKGYFVWSFLDNFEWNVGYTNRFGMYYIDYLDGFKRKEKSSVQWFKNLLELKQKSSSEEKTEGAVQRA